MTAKVTWTKLEPRGDPNHGRPLSRSSHGLSMVQNKSRLVLYGGEHIARTPLEPNQQTWAVDVAADGSVGPWRLIQPADGVTPPARVAHAQAVYNDNIIYIFGGRSGILMHECGMNDLWKLDCSGEPGTETWSLVEPDVTKGDGDAPPEERSFHKMLCIGSNLYVFGGCSTNHGRLADVYRFDIENNTWHNMGTSHFLRGRGGANLIPLASGTKLAVVAGFCGEETNDGHCFDVATGQWDEAPLTPLLDGLRPRSVCVSGAFPSTRFAVIFGGEVDPSAKGHEGAGGFENDVLILDEKSGMYLERIPAESSWPETRGWSDATSVDDNGVGRLFLFGGLSGDDENPKRMDDLWRLDVQAE